MTDQTDRISPRHSSSRAAGHSASRDGMRGRAAVRPATGEELQARRRDAAERFLRIAAALKAEAGVRRHDVCKELRGLAWCRSGVILAPEGRTRKQLYILAHECGHVALKHGSWRWRAPKPRHVEELEAEQWAHDALRRHGIPVPKKMTSRARWYVGHWIAKDERNGVVVPYEEALRFAGQLTKRRRTALRARSATPVRSHPTWIGRLLVRLFQRGKA